MFRTRILPSMVGLALLVGVVTLVAASIVAIGQYHAPPAAAVLPSSSPVPSATGSVAPSPTPSLAPPSASPIDSPSLSPASFPPLAAGIVPIVYMHRVEAPPADYPTWSQARQADFINYDIVPSAFQAQLDWLKAHAYTTILPRDLAAHWDRGTPLPPRPVILTFDDGWASWTRTILPMLQAHGMVAEFYLTLDAIADGRITWDEVRQLAAAGNGIGAHDVHHVQLAMLGANHPPASLDAMWYEVHQARLTIGSHLGTLPDSMAYVGGGYNADLEGLVKKAGYTTARAIVRGIAQVKADRFVLRVVRIGPYDDVVNVVTGELVPGLPVFAMRMAGVSDQPL
jgi:peptidoglycan/xylan/chitin deacetylase (PgdA/CDA1 family)